MRQSSPPGRPVIKYAKHLMADHDHVHCAGCGAIVSGPHQYALTGQWQRECPCGTITRYVLALPPGAVGDGVTPHGIAPDPSAPRWPGDAVGFVPFIIPPGDGEVK